MGIPVGMAGFGSAFMQAYQGTKDKNEADSRQKVLDEQRQQEFALQQASGQFNLQNAQKTAANEDTDRARTLKLQAVSDANAEHQRNIVGSYASGDVDSALKAIEDFHNTSPNAERVGKMSFLRGPDGQVVKDAKGNVTAQYIGQDGKVKKAVTETPEKMVAGTNAYFNSQGYLDSQAASAKDDRKYRQQLDLEKEKQKSAVVLQGMKEAGDTKRTNIMMGGRKDIAGIIHGDKAAPPENAGMIYATLKSLMPKIISTPQQAYDLHASYQQNPDLFVTDYVDAMKAQAGANGQTIRDGDPRIAAWEQQAQNIAVQRLGLGWQSQLAPAPAPNFPTVAPSFPAIKAGMNGNTTKAKPTDPAKAKHILGAM